MAAGAPGGGNGAGGGAWGPSLPVPRLVGFVGRAVELLAQLGIFGMRPGIVVAQLLVVAKEQLDRVGSGDLQDQRHARQTRL